MALAQDTGVEDQGGAAPDVAALLAAVDELSAFVDVFEPALCSGRVAEELVPVFTKVERLGAVGKTLAAARAAEANRHVSHGHRSPAEWLAAQTGSSIGEAKDTLQLGEDLASHPGVDEALRAGDLPLKRARMIAGAAKDNPAKEQELIDGARTDNQKQFAERCLKAAAEGRSVEDEAARLRAIHSRRHCKTWTDDEGFHLRALLTPQVGAQVEASLKDQADRIYRDLQQQGLFDESPAVNADALAALITGQGILPAPRRGRREQGGGGASDAGTGADTAAGATPGGRTADDGGSGPSAFTGPTAAGPASAADPSPGSAPPAPAPPPASCPNCDSRGGRPGTRGTVLIRVDLDALRRGSTGEGELCEIPGVGPIPVSHARDRLGEDLVYLLVTNGVDVTTVCRVGRHVPESLRVAILERDQCCVVPGCGVRQGLETDHWQVEYAKGGRISLDNLCRLCTHHHRLKTHQGWRLTGGPGRWEFVAPTSPRVPKRPKKKQPRKRPPPPGDPDPPLFHVEE